MIVVLTLLKGGDFQVLGQPFPTDLGGDLVGLIPVYETLEDAQKYWPDSKYTEARLLPGLDIEVDIVQ